MKHSLRSLLKWLAWCAAALAVIGISALVWIRLQPPSLGFFDAGIQAALRPLAPRFQVSYEEIRLAWPKGRLTPGVRITEARCLINGDTLLARVPEITVKLSLAALFHGRVTPTEIWLNQPHINLSHLSPASLPPTTEAADSPRLDLQNLPAVFRPLFDLAARHRDFKRLHAADGRLTLPGESQPLQMALPSVVLSTLHVQPTPEIILTANYSIDERSSRVHTVVHAPPEKGGDPDEIPESRIQFTNFRPPILAHLAPSLAPLMGFDMAADIEVRFRLDEGGTIQDLRFSMESENGGALRMPDIWEAPLPIDAFAAKGGLDNDFTRLELARVHVDSGGTTFDATGAVEPPGRFDTISLDMEIDGLNPAEAHRFWPHHLLPATRAWIRDHFLDGEIHDAVAKIRITPEALAAPVLPRDVLDVQAPFSKVSMKYLSKLAPIEDAEGTAHFTAHDITIDVTDARTYDTWATDGKVVIGNFTEPANTIEIQANANGPAQNLFTVVDGLTGGALPPVKITSGSAGTRLSFAWPLAHFSEATFDYHATAKIQGLEISDFQGVRWAQEDLLVTLDRNTIAVEGTDGEVSSKSHLESPIPLGRIAADGELSYNPAGIRVTSFLADLGGPTLQFSGQVHAADPFPRILIEGTVDDLPTEDFHRSWPTQFSAAARHWITTHAKGGRIPHAAFRVDLDPAVSSLEDLPESAITVEGSFTGLRLDYLPPLPPIQNARGTFTISARDSRVRLAAGELGQSWITEARADFSGIQSDRPAVDVVVGLQGPASDLADAAQIILEEDLAAVRLPPLTDALASTRIHCQFPLRENLTAADIHHDLSSEITNITAEGYFGFDLTDGRATASMDNGRFSLDGTVRCGKTPVAVQVAHGTDTQTTLHLSAAVDAEHLGDFRLPPLPFLTGTIQAGLDFTRTDAGAEIASRFDLTQAKVDLQTWGWMKPSGTPAILETQGILTDASTLAVSRLALSGDDLDVQGAGAVTFSSPMAFDLKLDPLHAGEHRLAAALSWNATQGLQASLTGKRLDASGLLNNRQPSPEASGARSADLPPGKPSPPTEDSTRLKGNVSFDVGEALLANGIVVDRPQGRIAWTGNKLQSAAVDGAFGKAPLHVSVTEEEAPDQILVQTEDAGALLKGIDLTHYIRGGRLVFEGRSGDLLPTAEPVSGTVKIRDYLLVRAPGLVKVLSMASFVGALGQLQRGGIHFRTLDGNLAFKDGIMTLTDGRMEGVSLAMTAEGTYDIERQMTDLGGIVIPVNVLNELLDMIPVIGKMIVGDGIIATNYTIQGPVGDPEVNIRPLSTLSVGFLRSFIKEIDLQPIEKGELTAPDAPGKPQK